MARIQKRVTAKGAPNYIVKWREPNGTDRSKGGFATMRAARDYVATEVDPKVRRGVAVDPSAGQATFRATAEEWLASRADLKPTTLAAYRDALAPTTDATSKRHKPLAHLRIDPVFGSCPLNSITRADVQGWVNRMIAAGKKPSTVRNAYFLVHQVLTFAYVEGRIPANPVEKKHIKLPTDHNTGRNVTVDDPDQFLTAAQVSALVAATPWPYNVLVHLAAWSGLRAAELAGLQVGDVALPKVSANPNAPARGGYVNVQRTVATLGGELRYVAPKTRGSRRRVPLPAHTRKILRDYLATHPRRAELGAPLFPGMALLVDRPAGVRATFTGDDGHTEDAKGVAARQAHALAGLSVEDAEARLVLDWNSPLRHATFYKAVYRPAVLRANRVAAASGSNVLLPPGLKFHPLRHTYASLCIAAGRPMFEVSRFMGHSKPSTTESVYAHLLEDDHADAMDALDHMATAASEAHAGNVIQLRG